ncbi:MAG: hypothetical protein IKN81_06500 [Oscillospiraceae bacterium]|nr:hypothetical protein [Oscillospiraceae bacterium]
MAEKRSGEQYRKLRLCIDSYDNKIFMGRLCFPGLETESFAFHSLTELLLKAEDLFEESHFPQSYTARRSFAPTALSEPDMHSDAMAVKGRLATFVIRVLFRQHASWQGSVTWVEGNGEQSFRSVLELVLLMDSALSGG